MLKKTFVQFFKNLTISKIVSSSNQSHAWACAVELSNLAKEHGEQGEVNDNDKHTSLLYQGKGNDSVLWPS